ncbi:hypothetical protein PROFUN_01420 [Planoprotostelium fungivorum]|uniref:Uncharacterized protein n=1 Tax=Planoprotostelium fungivorum TaxID=1890364 RepID=A0A2P6NTG6_9EUKA|nr:hypothetical protein PROFUN_01420 [Planoprotostelium fungivorum]
MIANISLHSLSEVSYLQINRVILRSMGQLTSVCVAQSVRVENSCILQEVDYQGDNHNYTSMSTLKIAKFSKDCFAEHAEGQRKSEITPKW